MEVELTAALLMLDEVHTALPTPKSDQNSYKLGSIAGHNVVIAVMPLTGNTVAAAVVAQLHVTFQNILYGLLVGIGGGVPVTSNGATIRLGDVVVSKPTDTHSGVVQYDRGKAESNQFVRTGALAPPPSILLSAANFAASERSTASIDQDPISKNLQLIDIEKPGLQHYRFPGAKNDCLFPASYKHVVRGKLCADCCDPKKQIVTAKSNPRMTEEIPYINIHRGTVACSSHVLKDGKRRDKWHDKYGVLCFETEAAGALSTDIRYLVIRGISDYCDSHKNDQWHGFAAAAAASYARQLFFHIPGSGFTRSVCIISKR